MKFPIISTIAVSLCALAASAQADIKIASVDVTELYKLFYKRFDVEVNLQAQKATIDQELKTRQEKLKALQEEDKKITARFDPSLSETAVKKLREEHNAKLNEIQAAQQELQTFVQRRRLAFEEMLKREMAALLQEVQTVIVEVTGNGSYDLVINSSALSAPSGTRVFPFIKATYDVTPEVLKKLNAGAPAGFDPKAELERMNSAAPANN